MSFERTCAVRGYDGALESGPANAMIEAHGSSWDSSGSRDIPDEAANFLYDGLPQHARVAYPYASDQFRPRRGIHRVLVTNRDSGELLRVLKSWIYTLYSSVQSSFEQRRMSKVKVFLCVSWILLLWWGEKQAFDSHTRECEWKKWEEWPAGATPHRMVLLADPQLVDPHTYLERPWPLLDLTILHTDQYLARSFHSLLYTLAPDSAFFLGDLMDGGREWATNTSESADPQWRKYRNDFWVAEYTRFKRIFLDRWNEGGRAERRFEQRSKFIASLPGNHDLGFGHGVQIPVRSRFETWVGNGNRIDIVGNHTFVSIDTVSLSAKSQRLGESQVDIPQIWKPTEAFVNEVQDRIYRAWNRESRHRRGEIENMRQLHAATDLAHPGAKIFDDFVTVNGSMPVPSILLTHVPLYREPGTLCGPLREHWPSKKSIADDAEHSERDDRNAIPVQSGYQYQNVLNPDISKLLAEKVPNIRQVFSGDDHDYCDIVHREFSGPGGGIREITVKSMSWAMGVRKPGFLLVSLWNPLDENGWSKDTKIGFLHGNTIQTHLCLLPDQLGIFVRYLQAAALTLFVLAVRAALVARHSATSEDPDTILPLHRASPFKPCPKKRDRANSSSISSLQSEESIYANGLAARSAVGSASRPTSLFESKNLEKGAGTSKYRAKTQSRLRMMFKETGHGLFVVSLVGLVWYLLLAYRY